MFMFSTKKYLSIFAAFAVGVIGAASYAVHAATITSSAAYNSPVQTTAQDPQQLDGEQADDSKATVTTSQAQEAESGPGDTGPDTGEASN